MAVDELEKARADFAQTWCELAVLQWSLDAMLLAPMDGSDNGAGVQARVVRWKGLLEQLNAAVAGYVQENRAMHERFWLSGANRTYTAYQESVRDRSVDADRHLRRRVGQLLEQLDVMMAEASTAVFAAQQVWRMPEPATTAVKTAVEAHCDCCSRFGVDMSASNAMETGLSTVESFGWLSDDDTDSLFGSNSQTKHAARSSSIGETSDDDCAQQAWEGSVDHVRKCMLNENDSQKDPPEFAGHEDKPLHGVQWMDDIWVDERGVSGDSESEDDVNDDPDGVCLEAPRTSEAHSTASPFQPTASDQQINPLDNQSMASDEPVLADIAVVQPAVLATATNQRRKIAQIASPLSYDAGWSEEMASRQAVMSASPFVISSRDADLAVAGTMRHARGSSQNDTDVVQNRQARIPEASSPARYYSHAMSLFERVLKDSNQMLPLQCADEQPEHPLHSKCMCEFEPLIDELTRLSNLSAPTPKKSSAVVAGVKFLRQVSSQKSHVVVGKVKSALREAHTFVSRSSSC